MERIEANVSLDFVKGAAIKVREDLREWGTMSSGKLGRTLWALGVAGLVALGIWWADPTSECWALGRCGMPGLQWPTGGSDLIGCPAGGGVPWLLSAGIG
jgi:hypothetical protein